MRRVQLGVLSFALPLLALSLVLAGCGGKEDKDKKAPTTTGDTKPATTTGDTKATPSGGAKAVEGKGKSTVKGVIKLASAEPDTKAMTDALLKQIDMNPDKGKCLAGSEHEKDQQVWRIGKNKQVANVFVWIKPVDRNQYFSVSDEQVTEAKDHPAVIDQPHCAFIPHCVVLFQNYYSPKAKKDVPTGQAFLVKNSASISHNTKWESPQSTASKTIPPGNEIQVPAKGKGFKPSNDPIHIACDIHKWMDAWALSVDNPYHAISAGPDQKVKADDNRYGSFEIKDVPAGVEVRIFAWHEKGGYLNKNGNKGEVIKIKEGETPKNFEITKTE